MSPAYARSEEVVTARSIAALLAPTLGWEKSSDMIAVVMRRLGMRDGALTAAQGYAILDELADEPGIAGVTARFVRTRADFGRRLGPASERHPRRPLPDRVEGPPSSRAPVPTPPRPIKPTLPVQEIALLLAHTMGREKSVEAIGAGVRRLGLPEEHLDRDQAGALFEDLAGQEGLVGITARFAKARLILKFGA
jgi:hypothetical protein